MIKMLAIKAVVKEGVIKPLEAIDLPEDKEIVVYVPEKKEEEESSFFFPSAFDFWNDPREDLHSENIS
jgi:predicted DNA-binding antitoxin AbrB/MazE fold protein